MPDTPAPEAPDGGPIGYGAALAELEAILDEIEDDAVDVDVLAARVKRAAELLRICRDRITAARIEVTQIVADLDPSSLEDEAPTGGGAR
ncbi:MAG TPA: exodeoxyribonuclease VII small subunit [Acidimicrobiales bacterium]|nr:exodeoxyribonuclease VII small subunit [Acidimicrobiales bacterium]